MGHEKFNQHKQGKYWKKYFENDKEFYGSIQRHLLKHIPKENATGIDIGAGPGIGARLFANLGFSIKITGFEPSKTFLDGENLSKELDNIKSPVKYSSINKGMSEIKTPKPESIDFILILRASHEIAESIGDKDKFFKELFRILAGLKKNGFLIIAEPQYSDNNVSSELIKKVQEYQMKNIGHCHVPSDYIISSEMKEKMQNFALKLIDESLVPNDKLLKFLRSEGLNLDRSPCSFYIQTFKK